MWFKAKLYGWGWVPVTWEGWALTAVYVVTLFGIFNDIDKKVQSGSNILIGNILCFVGLTLFFMVICYLTGEKPRWRWGK